MNRTIAFAVLSLAGFVAAGGCWENTPPPPPTPVPAAGTGIRPYDMPRPVDVPDYQFSPPGTFSDVPLVVDAVPETRDFMAAYNRIGRPRLTLFVNRSLEGNLIPVNPNDPLITVEHGRTSTGGVTVERTNERTRSGYYDQDRRERSDRFQSNGPAEYREKTQIFLPPGQYDEIAAKRIDYEAIENIMTDWLMARGQTTMISPTLVRQKLTEQQLKDLASGKLIVNAEIADQLGADVLIQVQAKPTRQTPQGLEVRIVAEAMNIRGGQSLGHAVVDVPPPLEKVTINRYTRFLARKLMDGMTGTWKTMAEVRPPDPTRTNPGGETTPPPAVTPPMIVPPPPPPVQPGPPTTVTPAPPDPFARPNPPTFEPIDPPAPVPPRHPIDPLPPTRPIPPPPPPPLPPPGTQPIPDPMPPTPVPLPPVPAPAN